MEPRPEARKVLEQLWRELLAFDEGDVRLHGTITVHIGEGDYQLVVNRHYKKFSRVEVSSGHTASK